MSDSTQQPVTPPPRVGPLNTVRRVREELAKVYKDARTSKIRTEDASRLAFILMTLYRVIEGGELEQRLATIEKVLEDDASEPTRPSLSH